MKNKMTKNVLFLFTISIMLTSCYSYTSVIGKGPQGSQVTSQWNHYIIYGLVPIGVSDSKQMAGGATDYSVNIQHSFVNGLIQAITFGIYTPTTTTVTK